MNKWYLLRKAKNAELLFHKTLMFVLNFFLIQLELFLPFNNFPVN